MKSKRFGYSKKLFVLLKNFLLSQEKFFLLGKLFFLFLWNFLFRENLDVASIIELQISIKIVFLCRLAEFSLR